MTLTLDLANSLIEQVQAAAAAEGITAEQYIESAVRASLSAAGTPGGAVVSDTLSSNARPWLDLIGSAREYAIELAAVDAATEAAFEQIENEDLP